MKILPLKKLQSTAALQNASRLSPVLSDLLSLMRMRSPVALVKNTLPYILLLFLTFLSSCQTNSCVLEPEIILVPQKRYIDCLPSAFPPLSPIEMKQDWGKELHIANTFAKDFDLYRAITSYKRALILIPRDKKIERRLQIQYCIVLCYYLGQKYQEAVESYETSDLTTVPESFPTSKELTLILYDSYTQIGDCEKAEHILEVIEQYFPDQANNLRLSTSIEEADFETLETFACDHPAQENFYSLMDLYQQNALSPKKAQTLNAILPGAGYYYVGQKKAALTSFLINAVFIAAAYEFFSHKNVPMGIILSSLEFGWYFGGINGAGLAAKEFNERLYETCAKETMLRTRLFPILMFETSF